MPDDRCMFCDLSTLREADVVRENEHCVYASMRDPTTDPDVLPGSGMIVPIAHRETAFDLTNEEWMATRDLLLEAKAAMDERLSPDGYTLIWNCYACGGQYATPLHAHFHVIPRFHDEPYAGRGGRWLIKQPENRRPDPSSPGLGLARPT